MNATRYLSTDTARGSLEISNPTRAAISYNPMGVSFLIREPDGGQREERLITTIAMLPTSTTIPPGEQRTFDIRLPGCQVLSDPCIERIAIKVVLNQFDPHPLQAVTDERAYQFIPDPTATFEGDGLRGNRPLFITQGDARGSVRQDVLRVAFSQIPGPQAAIPDLSDVFSSRGLEVKSRGGGDNTAYVDIGGAMSRSNQAVVDAAISEVERVDRGAILSTRAYVPALDAFDPLIETARDRGEVAASRLARLLDTSPVEYAGLTGDGTQVLLPERYVSATPDPWVSWMDMMADNATQKRLQRPTPGAVDVRVRLTGAHVGVASTVGLANRRFEGFADANASGFPTEVTPIPLSVSIAADRPEIFAIAASRRAAAERLGYDADALAMLSARDRVRAMARALGVRVSLVTLVVQYADGEISEHDPLATLGMAMPIENERSAVWRALVAAPIPTPTVPPYPAPSSASPNMQFRIVPLPRPTPTQPVRTQSVPQPDLVPITVLGASTALSAFGDTTIDARADSVRLDIRINGDVSNDAKSVQSVGPAEVVRRLRAQPLVADVRTERSSPNELSVGYELVVRTRNASAVQGLVKLTRAAYAGTRFTSSTNVANVMRDCHDLMTRATSISVSQAMKRAIAAARAENRKLRRLILAAAYPTGPGDACVADASLSPLDRATDEDIRMPDTDTVPIRASVKLVFRTTAQAR